MPFGRWVAEVPPQQSPRVWSVRRVWRNRRSPWEPSKRRRAGFRGRSMSQDILLDYFPCFFVELCVLKLFGKVCHRWECNWKTSLMSLRLQSALETCFCCFGYDDFWSPPIKIPSTSPQDSSFLEAAKTKWLGLLVGGLQLCTAAVTKAALKTHLEDRWKLAVLIHHWAIAGVSRFCFPYFSLQASVSIEKEGGNEKSELVAAIQGRPLHCLWLNSANQKTSWIIKFLEVKFCWSFFMGDHKAP